MRILRKRYKALYIVGGFAVSFLISFSLRGLPSLAGTVIGTCVSIAFYTIGVRSFRGPDEPVEPPRDWWRATARPTAGYWIGIVALLSTPGTFLGAHLRADRFSAAHLITVGFSFVFGLYYLTSSIRLSRLFGRARRISVGGETPSAAVRALALANAQASTVDAVFAMPRLRFAVAGDPADPSGFALTTADGVIRFLVTARYTDRRGVERALEQDAYAAAHHAGIEAMRPEEIAPLPNPA